ncbi:non-specific serine/threonine protein kinase [Trifolium repens]|nr:non-specific serine/threonine protein kinase [Trifolium repens]
MLYMDTIYKEPKILDRVQLTKKSDVYKFGVVLLEIMLGKQGQYSPREAMKVAQIVNKCLSDMPTCRPNMDEVVRLLELLQDSKDTVGGVDSPQSLDPAHVQ